MSIDLQYLEIENGISPFLQWEKKLDTTVRAAVRTRINRVRIGNFGDCTPIKGSQGIHELRVHLEPGYRIYFGKMKDTVVIILCGGDKRSQDRDIIKAKDYWQRYKDSLKKKQGKHG